jgi:hypothetical protein
MPHLRPHKKIAHKKIAHKKIAHKKIAHQVRDDIGVTALLQWRDQ